MACVECWTRALAGSTSAVIEDYRNHSDNALAMTAMLMGFHDRDVARYLRKIRDFAERAELPWGQQTEDNRQFGNASSSYGPWQQFTNPLSTFHLSAYYGVSSAIAAEQARSDTALLALAIERFRLANERLPETLDELAPRFIVEIRIDPYTGLPYVYDRLNPGYAIRTPPSNPHESADRFNQGIAIEVTR